MFNLFKTSKNPKIVKGKGGKKGLKINGKLVLPVKYDDIQVNGKFVWINELGAMRMTTIEDLLNPPGPATVSGKLI